LHNDRSLANPESSQEYQLIMEMLGIRKDGLAGGPARLNNSILVGLIMDMDSGVR
jgi:hypothetical protein